MFGVIMPLCNRMFCCIFGWYFYIEIRLKYEKNILFPALQLFHCQPLWKTVLFVSSRTLSFSTHCVDNSEATWKKATKCNKNTVWTVNDLSLTVHPVNSIFFLIWLKSTSTVLVLEESFDENNMKLQFDLHENKINFHR